MNRGTFTFKYTMGIWEAEMLIKALQNYNPTKTNEKYAKQDLIDNLQYQMQKEKEKQNEV